MAPSRYRSTSAVTRSNQPASKSSTRQNQKRPKTSVNQECESSGDENRDEAEFEPDLNELFIQSIEELLPERQANAGKSATPAPPLLETSPITPRNPIKVERVSDSIGDIYDASPTGHVYKAANFGRREASRSTAQLTTPASSPERKREKLHLVEEALLVNSEVSHENDERDSVLDSSCTPPASSPERNNVSKRPANKILQTTPQQFLSRAFHAPAKSQGIEQSSSSAGRHRNSAILQQRSNLERQSNLQKTTVSRQQRYALVSKVSQLQKDCEKLTANGNAGRKPRTDYPPIFSPLKVRPSTSKITTPPGPTRIVSTPPLTPKELLPAKGNTSKEGTCCKLMCLQCAPKDVLEEYGFGPPEKRPNMPRLKSLSACPPSVSSFGSDDDIPPPNKLHREVGRAVTESSKSFASNRLLGISPSLRYGNLPAHLGINRASPTDDEDRNDDYDDFEDDILPQKDPCRAVFGKAGKAVLNRGQRDVTGTPQSSNTIEDDTGKSEKKLQQILSRSLRSISAANDLTKKLQSLHQQTGQRDESHSSNKAFIGSQVNENCREDEDSDSEYEERTLRKAFTQASTKVKSIGQSVKRAREVIDDCQPTFPDDEDIADEGDIIEIDRDVFELSESRRQKRHKSRSQGDDGDAVLASPAPKEELVAENENTFTVGQETLTAEVSNKSNADNINQENTPCDYYMNTYWEHGRASDGRRARDAFVSYADFKRYCGKNNQPTDNRCLLLFKKDLKHYLLCEYHASLRQDLFRAAWNFEHNPGFSFKSCNKDEEIRRIQNEAIGNAPSPSSSSKGSAAVADGEMAEIIEEVLKLIGTSHTADVAQLKKSKNKLESEVKGLKRQLARIRKR